MSETTNILAVEPTKPYTLRKLDAQDVAPLCSIISKIGIKEIASCFQSVEIKDIIEEGENNDEMLEKAGITIFLNVASTIITNYSKCHDELLSFLASVAGLKKADVGKMDIDVFFNIIVDVVQKEEFQKVFKVASRLLK